jgi:hypothetical protein
VVQRIVAPNQSAFIKGRFILESVVVAHELVHSVHRSGQPGIIIKYYEKAYDRVSWNFLFDMLAARGFDLVWINWVRHIVTGAL